MGESLTQFLSSSLSFLSIGFSILTILPRFQKLIKERFDLELEKRKRVIHLRVPINYVLLKSY